MSCVRCKPPCGPLHAAPIFGRRCWSPPIWAMTRTTTAAIAGQLAGAIYGASGIPAEWLEALAWKDRLGETATRLFEAGWPEQDDAAGEPVSADQRAASWITQDWTVRERLEALAAFAPVFAATGFQAELDTPVARPDIYLGVTYAEETNRFIKMAYDYGWVRTLQWSEWRQTEHGRRMMQDPAAMACVDEDDLEHVLTTCMRADRFCDGYLADAFNAGLIARVVARAETLLREVLAEPKPEASHSRISRAQPHRAVLRQAQAIPARSHAIREARSQLSCNDQACIYPALVAG